MVSKMYIDIENPVLYKIILENMKKCENIAGNGYIIITDGKNIDDELEMQFQTDKYIGVFPDGRTGLVELVEFVLLILKDSYNLEINSVKELVANQQASRFVSYETYPRGSYYLSISKNYLQDNVEIIYKEEISKQVHKAID